MRLADTIHTSLDTLRSHRSRSVLTMLGIVIGIGAIIIVMSIGDSARDLILKEIEAFSPTLVIINPGRPSEGILGGSFESVVSDSLTKRDVEDLRKKSNVPDAISVTPTVMGSVTVTYGSETYGGTIWGGDGGIFDVYQIECSQGEAFTQEDVDARADIALIGTDVVEKLFGDTPPVGQKIKIKDKKLRVIGIITAKSATMAASVEGIVLVPYTTAQEDILGIRHFHEIAVEASSPETVPGVVKDIKQTLRDNHDIDDPQKDDFMVNTMEDSIKIIDSVLGAITAFLAMVAAISLVVGGVGVMNIMLVSVTERTREIGLRKALGATNRNILAQFLIEALFLTGIGGVIGIVCGMTTTGLITVVAAYATGIQFPFVFSVQGMLLGLAVAGGTGLVFGIFPARQAAKKSPIEALRYE